MIRALIVDDEPLAREGIREFLGGAPDVKIVGECANGSEALAAIVELSPDLVFLDVQMPEMSGFEVLAALDRRPIPAIIFITAYDQYALKAFDVHALDYLLKPIDADRFRETLERARKQLELQRSGQVSQHIVSLLTKLKTQQEREYIERLMVKSRGRVFFLRTAEIDWIEAAGNYVNLHVGEESHLIRETMAGLESKLDPNQFLRVHRSTIVNIARVEELQPWFSGEYAVILRDGTQLTLSRTYRSKLQGRLGSYL